MTTDFFSLNNVVNLKEKKETAYFIPNGKYNYFYLHFMSFYRNTKWPMYEYTHHYSQYKKYERDKIDLNSTQMTPNKMCMEF